MLSFPQEKINPGLEDLYKQALCTLERDAQENMWSNSSELSLDLLQSNAVFHARPYDTARSARDFCLLARYAIHCGNWHNEEAETTLARLETRANILIENTNTPPCILVPSF